MPADTLPPWAHPTNLPGLLMELFRLQGYQLLEALETPDRCVDFVIRRDTPFEHDLRLLRCYWVPPGTTLGRKVLDGFAEGLRQVPEVGGVLIVLGAMPPTTGAIAAALKVEIWDVATLETLFAGFDIPTAHLPLPPPSEAPIPEEIQPLGGPPADYGTLPPRLLRSITGDREKFGDRH